MSASSSLKFKVVAVSALPDAPQGLDELLQFFTTAAQAKT